MIGAHLLHVVAWAALATQSPLRAKRLVELVARAAPRLKDEAEARGVADRLKGGTCLSRALVVAALMPAAEIVIGVRPAGGGRLRAHAWIEIEGRAILDEPSYGGVITRMARGRVFEARVS